VYIFFELKLPGLPLDVVPLLRYEPEVLETDKGS
jgi:hypothetical protein